MGPKKKKIVNIEKNLADELVDNFLNSTENIPCLKHFFSTKPHISILKKVELGDALKELYTFIDNFIPRLVQELGSENNSKNESLVIAIIRFLKLLIDLPSEYYVFSNFFQCMNQISHIMTLPGMSTIILQETLAVCEESLQQHKDQISQIHKSAFCVINTLYYMMKQTFSEDVADKATVKSYIKRVWNIRSYINKDYFCNEGPPYGVVREFLLLTITNINYLKYKEGQHFIGNFMHQDVVLVKLMHSMILNELPKLEKPLAHNYGTVYFIAWSYASDDDIRTEIENCIQDIMNKALNMPRNRFEVSKAGVNLLAVLSKLHESRNTKSFSHVLDNLYGPILWRTLKSHDAWQRCNGAQVFLDVFPLEKPFLAAHENADYMERQIAQIKELLLDDSHYVRTMSIKGVCSALISSIELYSVSRLREIFFILFDKLPRDGSSYMVRKAVFDGLESLLEVHVTQENSITSVLLDPVFICVREAFTDYNEKVRKSFVKFLLKLKKRQPYLSTTYWDVIPLKEIILWLSMPLSFLSRFVEKKFGPKWGNMIVWSSLIVGQPLCIMMYYHDYVITHFGESLIESYASV